MVGTEGNGACNPVAPSTPAVPLTRVVLKTPSPSHLAAVAVSHLAVERRLVCMTITVAVAHLHPVALCMAARLGLPSSAVLVVGAPSLVANTAAAVCAEVAVGAEDLCSFAAVALCLAARLCLASSAVLVAPCLVAHAVAVCAVAEDKVALWVHGHGLVGDEVHWALENLVSPAVTSAVLGASEAAPLPLVFLTWRRVYQLKTTRMLLPTCEI